MKTIPFVLRDHRDELWRRWADSLDERVSVDYRKLIASPLGERIVRAFIDELCAASEAEEYEVPGLVRGAEERVAAEARSRLAVGFSSDDMVIALQSLRGAIVDVLVDALVLDEMPSFADSLMQMRRADAFLDRLVCATMRAGGAPGSSTLDERA